MKHLVFARLLVMPILIAILFLMPKYFRTQHASPVSAAASPSDVKKYIKWVDFDVTAAAMRQALRYDVDTYGQEPHLDWIELLAWLGARYGGDFSRYRQSDLDGLAQKLMGGASMNDLTKDMKYYSYYLEAYGAVLGGMVGTYQIQIPADQAGAAAPRTQGPSASDPAAPVWVSKYGLKAFSPIAKNYPYQDFDDFGAARSYGFRRQHLGHDMMGQVGTPVFAQNYIFPLNCSPLILK